MISVKKQKQAIAKMVFKILNLLFYYLDFIRYFPLRFKLKEVYYD